MGGDGGWGVGVGVAVGVGGGGERRYCEMHQNGKEYKITRRIRRSLICISRISVQVCVEPQRQCDP